jgi:hypothetical protein
MVNWDREIVERDGKKYAVWSDGREIPIEEICKCDGCGGYVGSEKEYCASHDGLEPGRFEEGNMAGMTHGMTADPVNLFDWLEDNEPEGLAWILNKLYSHAQEAPKDVFIADFTREDISDFSDAETRLTAYGSELLLLCIRDYTRWRATKRQLAEGIISRQEKMTEQGPWETEDANPVNLELDRLDKTTMKEKDKLGLLPSPESKKADAQQDMAELFKEDLEVDE